MDSVARKYLVEVLSMASKKIKKSVVQRVKSGLCLIPGCDGKIQGRGLCSVHRDKFYNEMRKIEGKEAQIEFEANCISEGLVLPAREQLSIMKQADNPFQSAKAS